MNYYRKYRPQTVAQIDLVSVRQAFERILKSGQVTHAYFFSGPKGTGKTSAARILAKILHCAKNSEKMLVTNDKPKGFVEPCNECDSCRAIMAGSHLGVVEMDAASNRGIDEIRVLRERIGLAPAQGPYTVYVIDEAHMLTAEAFNALLKTLEEPPAHAVFVLATTEARKVPETIISRCHEITFTRATREEMVHSLRKATEGEKLIIEPKVLDLIARRADGSFRDAMKMLEQAAERGKQVELHTVEQLLGLGEAYDPNPLITALLSGDRVGAMGVIQRKLQDGVDIQLFGLRLLESLREKLVEAVLGGQNLEILGLSKLTEVMAQAVGEMKQSPIPQLPLEIAVAEWGGDEVTSQPVVLKKKDEPKRQEEPRVNKSPVSGRQVTLEEVKEKWVEILKAVKPLNHSLEALLRSARPITVRDNWLTIEVFYNFHKEQLEQERYRRMLEDKAGEIMQAVIRLKYILGKKVAEAERNAPVAVTNITGEVADEELAKAAEEIFG